jgi:hypothetical protein
MDHDKTINGDNVERRKEKRKLFDTEKEVYKKKKGVIS